MELYLKNQKFNQVQEFNQAQVSSWSQEEKLFQHHHLHKVLIQQIKIYKKSYQLLHLTLIIQIKVLLQL